MNVKDKTENISERLFFGLMLSVSGGLMDAYSFLFRGGVFANAQTGNILLLGVNLSRGEWGDAFRYFLPVAAFSLGIASSFLLRSFSKNKRSWQKYALSIEILLFIAAAFIPTDLNNIANALISLACGIQLEAFSVINANNVATTMCIGNLRSAIDNALDYCRTKKKSSLQRAGVYAAVIAAFVLGAVIGSVLIEAVGAFAIIACAVIIAVCLAIEIFC